MFAFGCSKKKDPEEAATSAQRPPPTQRSDAPPATTVEAPPAADAGQALPVGDVGGKVAFVREREERREAWLANADGSGARALKGPPGFDVYPAAASRDGRLLVGVVARGEEPLHEEQLIVWTLATGEFRLVGPVSPRTRHPSFSPDASFIVFESGANSFADIYRVRPDGKDLKRLTENKEGNFEPSWSADGEHIVFVSSRDGDPEIYRMAPDGEGEERLTAFHMEDLAPKASPRTDQVAFISNREGEDAVFVMALDGTKQRRLVPKPPGQGRPPAEREIAWAPDGKRLAFVQKAGPSATRIIVADLEGGKSWPVTSGGALEDMPAWSPDGKVLAFVSDKGGKPSLHLILAEGTGRRPVFGADVKAGDWLPVWVPTGTRPASSP